MAFGRVNQQFRLEDQGITGLGNIYYNLIEPTLIEKALERKEGQLGKGGAFLVTTGKFTGRSPKDKHVVKTDDVLRDYLVGKIIKPCHQKVLKPCTPICLSI